MKEVKKSSLNSDSFFYTQEVQVNNKIIVRGRIGSKTAYFIEKRDLCGHLVQSNTYNSLKSLKAVL